MRSRKVVLLIVVFLILGCKEKMLLGEKFHRIKFQNEANRAIYFYQAGLNSLSQYPDTIPPVGRKDFVKIEAKKPFYIDSRKTWEENFKTLRKDTLSMYIIDATVFETKSWEQIRTDYDILKRYDLSIQDLQKLDFNVVYPAKAAMKDMKMWPKYGN